MIPLALQLFDEPGGNEIAYFSDATECNIETGEHGFRSLTCTVPMSLADAFNYYALAPSKWLSLNYGGGVVWEGRIEDRALVSGGLRLTALGMWRALTDVPYTALWSVSGTAGWRVVTGDEAAIRTPEKYVMDNINRLFVGLKKGTVYSTGDQGTFKLVHPYNGSRKVKSVMFDYKFLASASYQANLNAFNQGFTSAVNEWQLAGTGSVLSGSRRIELSAEKDFIIFEIRCSAGATYSGEDGAHYLKITNVRVVTSVASKISTSFTATLAATGSQTVTVGSTDGMYVGQNLIVEQGSSNRERVVVTAVNSSTQFTAVFANTHSIGQTVEADTVYADEIIKDLVAHVVTDNPDQLSTDTSLIQSPGLDLLNESYEDMLPADIITNLVGLGDNQTPPRQWEAGVWENKHLHFRPQESAGREWSIDVNDLTVDSTLETLVNSAYAVYQDANNRTLRTAVSDDAASQSLYDIVRRRAVRTNTTSATQAGKHRDAVIADGATIKPRSSLQPDYLMDAQGAIYPKWMCRAGDTVTIRNLPPNVAADIDRIRTFRVSETSYDVINDVLRITPETPLPSLDFLIAREARGY